MALSVQRRKVWLTPTTRVPHSNAAKTRKPLKFAGVPQTRQQISAVNRPKFIILRGHVKDLSMFNKFFFQLSIHASAAKIQPDKVVGWCQNGDFLRPVYSASHVQNISDVHSKFALRPHHQSPTAEIRRGKKRKKKDRNHRAKI